MVIIVMGVTGSGKTTVGRQLAEELEWGFYDADDFHSEANKTKMNQAIPLNDDDRRPWLETLRGFISDKGSHENFVLACSALKQTYRDILTDTSTPVQIVYLCGPEELIRGRLEARKGHYMNPKLLSSQFEALEEPNPVDTLYIDIQPQPEEIVRIIRESFVI